MTFWLPAGVVCDICIIQCKYETTATKIAMFKKINSSKLQQLCKKGCMKLKLNHTGFYPVIKGHVGVILVCKNGSQLPKAWL